MAKGKDQGLGGIFRPTDSGSSVRRPDPGDYSDLDEGNIKATGIGLREGELRALEQIAGEVSDPPVARNALMRWAMRWFIMQYRAGKIDLSEFLEEPPPPKKTLRLPGGKKR